jgi:hypothetical protein
MRKNRKFPIGRHNEFFVPTFYSRLVSCSNSHNDSLSCLDRYLYCRQSSEIYCMIYTCSTVGLRYRFGWSIGCSVWSSISHKECNWVYMRGYRQGRIAIVIVSPFLQNNKWNWIPSKSRTSLHCLFERVHWFEMLWNRGLCTLRDSARRESNVVDRRWRPYTPSFSRSQGKGQQIANKSRTRDEWGWVWELAGGLFN